MDGNLPFSILIVDDNTNDLDILNNLLKSQYTLYFSKSGTDAVKRASQNQPDLILLDVMMPDMNGFEVLSQLKDSNTTRNIPVIFITGLNRMEDEEKGFLFGAVDYIRKPFHTSIVKARIKAHLNIAVQMNTTDGASLVIKTKKEVHNIIFRELIYVSVSGHWLSFYLVSGEIIKIYSSLKKYEEVLLADSRFVHCHKSFIINMDYIKTVEVNNVLMKNDALLPISKKYTNLKKHYSEWITH